MKQILKRNKQNDTNLEEKQAKWNKAQWNKAQWNKAQWNKAHWNKAQWNKIVMPNKAKMKPNKLKQSACKNMQNYV